MWPSSSSLRWLENILAERLGVGFRLNLVTRDCLELLLPGAGKHISFRCNGHWFPHGRSDIPCAFWTGDSGWALNGVKPLPLIGVDEVPNPLISTTTRGVHFSYDVLGLVYWCLTRCEEIGRSDLDSIGRFPANASHAYANGYLQRPIVDEWLLVLRLVVQGVWPTLELKRSEFSVRLSHDVDSPARYGFSTPSRFLRSVAGDLLIRKSLRAVLRSPWLYWGGRDRLHPSDPLNTFEWIMDRSDEYGLKSAFYFICGRTNPARDALYDVDQPAIRKLIRRIFDRGHEVGLHPSFETYLNPDAIVVEMAHLKRVCAEEGVHQESWGGRMHYLRWRHPETMRAWEKAGMLYDSTLGYPETPGFRCGTCIEYQAFDPVALEPLKLRIRPLVAMDVSVIADQYLGLVRSNEALDVFKQVIDACKAVSGTFSLLWHNCQLETLVGKDLFCRTLDEAKRPVIIGR